MVVYLQSILLYVVILIATSPKHFMASAIDCQQGYTGYALKPGSNCGQYVQCVNGNVVETLSCPSGTLFNGDVSNSGVCDWADLVECKDIATTEPTLPATTSTSTAGTDASSIDSDGTTLLSNNSFNYYCGSTYQDASELCIPCPSGSLSECMDPRHGCFAGVECTISNPAANGEIELATKLASGLKITIEMDKNFDHNVNCSLGDWGLCYTKTVIIDYVGDDDYHDK